MVQLGFVLDQTRCIGCHACTVACKSENDVPLGDFRTWVKYTEEGSFPQVKRSFTVLRCNQCTDAPCVEICPTAALSKRADGIVDIDPAACIGCKSCMQACPYDALYINDDSGTAEKCHFCAHRTEVGLAPACAVVCPTEAIIPGDFHDPLSVVSQLRDGGGLRARKVEAGTGPNVLYKGAASAGLDPLLTQRQGGFIWADRRGDPSVDAFQRSRGKTAARTVYEVERSPHWGAAITNYLFAKSLSAGAFLAALPWLASGAWDDSLVRLIAPILGLLTLALTLVLLVADLKRPERFLLILLRPNWSSWLTKGSVILMGYGGMLSLWLAHGLLGGLIPEGPLRAGATGLTAILAALTACYTAWLFGQAKGRALWMRKGLAWHLIAQAGLAGGAALLIASAAGLELGELAGLRWLTLTALLAHAVLSGAEEYLAPEGREREYHEAAALIDVGPLAWRHHIFGRGLGMLVPALLLFSPWPMAWAVAGVASLIGLWVEEDNFVRAGQMLPIS